MLPSRDQDLSKTTLNNRLLQAIEKGDDENVAGLIAAGADSDYRNEDQQTPLYTASWLGRTRIVELLLQGGANPDAKSNGASPIYIATLKGFTAIVSQLITALLKQGIDLTLSYIFTSTENTKQCCHPVRYAIKKGHFDILILFIEKAGLPISFREPDFATCPGASLLHYAAMRREDAQPIIDYLCERQLDPDITDNLGNTPVHTGVIHNNVYTIRHLVTYSKAEYNAKNNERKTPLEIAINFGHIEAAKELIVYLAQDTNNSNIAAHLALIYSAQGKIEDKITLLKLLIKLYRPNAKISPTDFHRTVNELLFGAAGKDNEPAVDALLLLGANANYIVQEKNNSWTVIANAAYYGHTAVVRKLVLAGAQIYFNNISALLTACHQGNTETVAALIEMRADLTQFIKTESLVYRHPIHIAAQQGRHLVVAQLIKAGVNPNTKMSGTLSYGSTAFQLAATNGQVEVLRVLIEAGVKPERESSRGFTALYHAAYAHQESAVRFLLGNKACPMAKSSWWGGYSPLFGSYRAEQGYDSVTANILIDAIAKMTTAENLSDHLDSILGSIPEFVRNRMSLATHLICTFIISLFSVTHIKAADLIAWSRLIADNLSDYKLAKEVLYYVDSLNPDKNELYAICNEALNNRQSLRAALLYINRMGTECSAEKGTLAKYTALRKQLHSEYYDDVQRQLDERHAAHLSQIENKIAAAIHYNDDAAVMAHLKSLHEYNRLYPKQNVLERLKYFDSAHNSALAALYASLGDQLHAVAVPSVLPVLRVPYAATVSTSESFSHSLFAPVRPEAAHCIVIPVANPQITPISIPSDNLTADDFANHPYLNIAPYAIPQISQIESAQTIAPAVSPLFPAVREQSPPLLLPQPSFARSTQSIFTQVNSPNLDNELIAIDDMLEQAESPLPLPSVPRQKPKKSKPSVQVMQSNLV